MEHARCLECKVETVVVEDQTSGDVICTNCGLVLESSIVKVRAEWRATECDYSSTPSSRDPVRVGRSAPPLTSPELFTMIFQRPGCAGNKDLIRSQLKYGSKLDNLAQPAIATVCAMAERLALVQTTTGYAVEIYKRSKDMTSIRGKGNNVILAACLYLACRMENKAQRTFKEIAKAAGAYVRRSCSRLQMKNTNHHQFAEAVTETINNCKDVLLIQRRPMSLVAATIFMLSQRTKDKQTLKEVSEATDVAESTVYKTYKEISSTPEIIPQWFQKENLILAN